MHDHELWMSILFCVPFPNRTFSFAFMRCTVQNMAGMNLFQLTGVPLIRLHHFTILLLQSFRMKNPGFMRTVRLFMCQIFARIVYSIPLRVGWTAFSVKMAQSSCPTVNNEHRAVALHCWVFYPAYNDSSDRFCSNRVQLVYSVIVFSYCMWTISNEWNISWICVRKNRWQQSNWAFPHIQ